MSISPDSLDSPSNEVVDTDVMGAHAFVPEQPVTTVVPATPVESTTSTPVRAAAPVAPVTTAAPVTPVTVVTPVATPAPDNEETFRGSRNAVSYVPSASFSLIFGGLFALLLAAWAGLVPYLGPTFGFSADGRSSWTWNEVHTFGALVPGIVGVFGCLLVLACARRPEGMQSAGILAVAGFIVFLCGAWLTVVPVVWPVIVAPYFHVASPSMTLAYWLGYASGPGVLLASFGAFVMGRARGEAIASPLVPA